MSGPKMKGSISRPNVAQMNNPRIRRSSITGNVLQSGNMSSKQAGSWDLDRIVKALRTRIELLLARQASNPSQRLLVALAGVPGAGKTAVTSALLRDLSTREIDGVVVVPMVQHMLLQSDSTS